MRIQTRILVLGASLCMLACNNPKGDKRENAEIQFDEAKWKTKEDSDYPYRDAMLKDLIDSRKLKTLKGNEVFDLLGEPDRIDSRFLFYRVAQERIGVFPLHTKALVIKLSEDSTVNWVKIHQ